MMNKKNYTTPQVKIATVQLFSIMAGSTTVPIDTTTPVPPSQAESKSSTFSDDTQSSWGNAW